MYYCKEFYREEKQKFSTTTYSNLAKCPPINATSTDNRKLQCDHPNRKYLYLRQYDRHHYNSDGKPSIRASSQKVSTGYHQRQPANSDVAAKTKNSYITGTTTDSVEIPTASRVFWPLRVRIMCPEVIMTMSDNRKWHYGLQNRLQNRKYLYRLNHDR